MGTVETKRTLSGEASRSNIYNMDPSAIVIPGYDNDDKPDDAKVLYDERIGREVPTWLIDSIDELGVLEPILVHKTEDQIEVVAGQFRVRATREVNKRRKRRGLEACLVPCVRKAGSTGELFEMKLAENELRTEDPPLTKAVKAERYITLYGKTEKDAARAFGVLPETVRGWRSLLTLPPKIQKAVETGRIGATSGAHLASIGDAEKQVAAFEDLMAKGKDRASTGEVAHAARKAKAATKDDDTTPPQARRVIRKLIEAQAKGTIELNEGFIDALRWVIGEVSDRKINGLGAALRILKLKE